MRVCGQPYHGLSNVPIMGCEHSDGHGVRRRERKGEGS